MAATEPTLPSTVPGGASEAGAGGTTPTTGSVAIGAIPRAEGDSAPVGARLAERIVQLQPFRETGERAARGSTPVVVTLQLPKAGDQLPYRVDDAQTLAGLGFDPARVAAPVPTNESARLSVLARALTTLPDNAPREAAKLASVSSILPSHPPAAPLLAPAPTATTSAYPEGAITYPTAVTRPGATMPQNLGMLEQAPGFAIGLAMAVVVGIGLYFWLVS